MLPSASGKTKLFAKNSSKNFHLFDSGISLPAVPSIANLKIHRISAALRLVEVALYFSINIPYGLPWGFAVMSGLVLLITTCMCRISYRNKVYGTAGPSHGACFDTWNCFVDYFCYLFSSVK